MPTEEEIRQLTSQLYPKGRAFKHPPDGVMDKIKRALAVRETQAFNDAKSILNSILPDNADFDADDATDWERRLGLISNPLVSLADRKLAIIRKMNHPGTIPARQHYLYLEKQLQDAGFNVWVHENPLGISPEDYIVAGNTISQYGDFEYGENEYGDATQNIQSPVQYGYPLQYGMLQYGTNYNNQVVNYIDPVLDAVWSHGSSFRGSFFIGGQVFGTFADVQNIRQPEFRQLILRTKPTSLVGFLFINYI